jgi:hypothetical protein
MFNLFQLSKDSGPRWHDRQVPDECCHVLDRVTLETHNHIPWLEIRLRSRTVHLDPLDEDPLDVILSLQLETEPAAWGLARRYLGNQLFCLSLRARLVEERCVILQERHETELPLSRSVYMLCIEQSPCQGTCCT